MVGWIGSVRRLVIRPVWMQWERGFGKLSRLRGAYSAKFGICSVMVRKYRGNVIRCADGTDIASGDWIGELHLDNVMVLELLQQNGTDRAALLVARQVGEAMKMICLALEIRPELSNVKGLIGITLLHRGLTHGLGFERHELHSPIFRWLTTIYLRVLLSIMHPDGSKRISRRKKRLVPILLVQSRQSLRNRFA